MISIIGIGANLPGLHGEPAIETCRAAAAALGTIPALRLVGLSRWWRTAPVPASAQPDFINGVALLSGEADPARLLAALHAIEDRFGRRRSVPNAARTLDLDLIAMDDRVRDRPDPVLPHPRAHLRAFVLCPLADVLPDWVHPRLGLSLRGLVADLPAQPAEPLQPVGSERGDGL